MKAWVTVRLVLLRYLARMGWAGILGAGLGMFALAFFYSGNRERENQLLDLARQRQALVAQINHEYKNEMSPQLILNQFVQRLPASSSLPDILLQLDTRARRYGLSPSRAEYSESALSGSGSGAGTKVVNGKFRKIRISMPVKGEYAAVRDWLVDALASIPGLSVDALDFQRKDMNQPMLDVQIHLAVYMRGQS